jgi:hypothetical protein
MGRNMNLPTPLTSVVLLTVASPIRSLKAAQDKILLMTLQPFSWGLSCPSSPINFLRSLQPHRHQLQEPDRWQRCPIEPEYDTGVSRCYWRGCLACTVVEDGWASEQLCQLTKIRARTPEALDHHHHRGDPVVRSHKLRASCLAL